MTNQSNKRSHTGRRIYVTVFRGIAQVDWSTVPDGVEVEIIDRDALEEPETAARLSGAARQYAKRQLTWFRSDPRIQWVEGFGTDAYTIDRCESLVRGWL